MAGLRCTIAILPAENGDPERLLASLGHAKQAGLGDFADIVPLPVPAAAPSPGTGEAESARSAEPGEGFWRCVLRS